jgi:8-oxo-dGTP pyrophosphatase MutT (NUDIX family)
MQMTPWQRLRTRWYLFAVAIKRRLTLGARAVMFDGDKVLLVRLGYLPGWHFPGGGVEPGESTEAAAAREALEETGYTVSGKPALHGLFLNRALGTNRDHVAVFVWRNCTVARPFRPNFEIVECAWFAVDALPLDVEPGTAARIREIVSGSVPPLEWQP